MNVTVSIKTLIPDTSAIFPTYTDSPDTFLCPSLNPVSPHFCQFHSRKKAFNFCKTHSPQCTGVVCAIDTNHAILCTCTALPVQSTKLPNTVSQSAFVVAMSSLPTSGLESITNAANETPIGPVFQSLNLAESFCLTSPACLSVLCSNGSSVECQGAGMPLFSDSGNSNTNSTSLGLTNANGSAISSGPQPATITNDDTLWTQRKQKISGNSSTSEIRDNPPPSVNYGVIVGVPAFIAVSLLVAAGYIYSNREKIIKRQPSGAGPKADSPHDNSAGSPPPLDLLTANSEEISIFPSIKPKSEINDKQLFHGMQHRLGIQNCELNSPPAKRLNYDFNLISRGYSLYPPQRSDLEPSNSRLLEINPNASNWTTHQTHNWLLEIGASSETAQVALEQDIDGRALLLIQPNEIGRVFGEGLKVGERLRIEEGLEEVRKIVAVAALPPSYEEYSN